MSESEEPDKQWIRRRLGLGLPALAALSAICFLGVEEWVKMHGLADGLFMLPYANTGVMIMIGGVIVFSRNSLWIMVGIFALILGTSMAIIAAYTALFPP